MDKSKLVKCEACGKDISKGARTCPQCGETTKTGQTFWIWGGIGLIGLLLQAIANGC
jgi:uncharacterized protein (UPF0212 family)